MIPTCSATSAAPSRTTSGSTYQVTRDIEFLQAYGAELILEIARFWSSIATFNDERGRYEICGVVGPDEFHDGYPDCTEPRPQQ